MITFRHKGNFDKTVKFFDRVLHANYLAGLDKYGQMGVKALSEATPVLSGKTASSWGYQISKGHGSFSIHWTNSNINDGVPIAVIIQYGHGTGWGGYVQGIDYINPALRPVFQDIADQVWKEVTAK